MKNNKKFGVITELWPYLQKYKLLMVGAVLALSIAATTVLFMGWGLRNLVDHGFADGNISFLNQALMTLFVIIAVLSLASYSRFFLVSKIGEHVIADIRNKIYAHVIRLDPAFFETHKTGEIISRLTADASVLQLVVSNTVPFAMRNVLMLTGGLVMLCYTSPRLTGFVLLVVPLVIATIVFFGRHVRKKSRALQDQVGDTSSYVDETIHAVRTVQSFAQEDYATAGFSGYIDKTLSLAMSYIRARALMTALVIFIIFTAVGIVLWIGGRDVLMGHMSAGELSSFIFYAIIVAASAGSLSEVAGALQRATGAAEGLLSFLSETPDVKEPTSPKEIKNAKDIVFENISFEYPMRKGQQVLKNINLTIKKGDTVAIVGASGCGKSTLFQLLLRFYDPASGRILINGTDIKDVMTQDLRQLMGVVPQEPDIFSTSVLENIRYARPEASIDEVKKAAKLAHAQTFIKDLPNGYDTLLGERGSRLSGGQKQRIAIARAILKNPDILLLDEATSALDSQSELAVQQALETVMKDRTTLIIAHRLATIQHADCIIVMDQGEIVESGTHDELRKQKDSLYARMAGLQMDLKTA